MKTEMKPYPLIHPTTIVVVGTKFDTSINFTTIGDVAIAGLNPPLVMISLHTKHLATSHIRNTMRFSINTTIPTLLQKVDFCGIHSGRTIDKSSVFKYSLINDVPVIDESPINLIVEVVKTVRVDTREILVCSVIKTLIDEGLVRESSLDFTSLQSILYGLDNKYYSNFTMIGEGYKEGL